jgi:predicted  nucleic acid-binding Zn-ribbon protein
MACAEGGLFMDKLELLWAYQQDDMANDSMENEMKSSPARARYIKSRDYLKEQQDTVKRIDSEGVEMADRVDVVKDAVKRLEEQVTALRTSYSTAEPQNLEETRRMLQDARNAYNGISSYEMEMKKLKRDAEDRDRLRTDMRSNMKPLLAEYNELKKIYDEERKDKSERLEDCRARTAQKEQYIDPALLEKYRVIKTRCVPPVVKLMGDQCGGCNMSLPSVTLRNIRSKTVVVECETCGRMIIL